MIRPTTLFIRHSTMMFLFKLRLLIVCTTKAILVRHTTLHLQFWPSMDITRFVFFVIYKLCDVLFYLKLFKECILVHIACLVALRKHNALFVLSHKLVDTMKESHITWYAVACYYYTVEQFTTAKKFLGEFNF